MNQDWLAPPKVPIPRFARGVAIWSGVVVALGGVFVCVDILTVWTFAICVLLVGGVGAVTVKAYALLLRKSHHSPPEQMPLIHALLTAMTMTFGLIVLGVMVAGAGRGWSGAVLGNLWIPPLMFGATLATGAWTRRVGETLHCPKCEYEFAFDDRERAPVRCPECGTGWLGLLKKGRKVRSWRLSAAGLTIALAAFFVTHPSFWLGLVAQWLPTPALYAVLYTGPSHCGIAWRELEKRSLDETWTRRMGERVLGLRASDQWEQDASVWFETMMGKGLMPDNLVTRMYREGFQAELIVPRRVERGERFAASLRVKQATDLGASRLCVLFGGYEIADGPPVGERREAEWGFRLRPGSFSRYQESFPETLTTARETYVRVRAVYWVIYVPNFAAKIRWANDRVPQRPSNALWFERVELEKTVEVK